ncbi:hypothetical protein [Paenibacillus gallinarum]|uniref:Uncharacterized protein n=1 Tax=Paenibacillus gallinarum TaxID=2762232 RepID=A0ABR8T3B2_9BACL|nr:hypothetical protein [Paenibacillus gallinarum]MBD7970263.1 hypothetical protein [Paenibacillus gallinarum]
MGFTKGSWDIFKPLIEALYPNSKFHQVHQGDFILIVEQFEDETYVHRIVPETGDLQTLDNWCLWMWKQNLWLQEPIKIIATWSLHTNKNGYYSVFDDYDVAIELMQLTGHTVVQGFSTDHPLPNVGKFYVDKDELIEDILNEEYMTQDLITDTTEVK